MADDRAADPELQNDVDSLILDYLANKAVKAVLKECAEPSSGASSDPDVQTQLLLVGSYSSLTLNRPDAHLSLSLRLRLRLLQFATLFSVFYQAHYGHDIASFSRFSSESLDRLRQNERQRACAWYDSRRATQDTAAEEDALWSSFALPQKLQSTQSERGSPQVSLMDLVPLYIALSATRARIGYQLQYADEVEATQNADHDTLPAWRMTPEWLSQCATPLIQHAVYLSCMESPDSAEDILKRGFAWGPVPAPQKTPDGTAHKQEAPLSSAKQRAENSIFELGTPQSSPEDGADHGEAWYRIRREAVREVVEKLASGAPADDLKDRGMGNLATLCDSLRSFLHALNKSIAKPILAQLEEPDEDETSDAQAGKMELDGHELSSDEVQRLRGITGRGWMALRGRR